MPTIRHIRKTITISTICMCSGLALGFVLRSLHGGSSRSSPDHEDHSLEVSTNNLRDHDLRNGTSGSSMLVAPSASASPLTIRNWSCQLNNTPFIFVHIGKCGGGANRRFLLSAGKNYTKNTTRQWYTPSEHDNVFYPLPPSPATPRNGTRRARFFNGAFGNSRPPNWCQYEGSLNCSRSTFEGTRACPAISPLGFSFACHQNSHSPATRTDQKVNQVCGRNSGADCDVVYAGHNLLGAEMTWLPWPYLSKWWEHHSAKLGLPGGTSIPGSRHACTQGATRAEAKKENSGLGSKRYETCVKPAAQAADAEAARAFSNGENRTSWASLYASLPVLRVTMLREPFSFLISKFFWHRAGSRGMVCETGAGGWVTEYALTYLDYICGEDCVAMRSRGDAQLDELETQASENLRYSFAVVGVLERTDRFYEMVRKRVAYLDNFALDAKAGSGGKHASGGGEAKQVCKDAFSDPLRRQELVRENPVLGAIVRLYQVALQVESHQYDELSMCVS